MGRAKEFEEEVVLEKAMRTFWEKGYEKTSMQDLVTQMGIHRRSIYDTFGDKHALFLQTLDYYEAGLNEMIGRQVKRDLSIKDQLEALFSIIVFADANQPRGCFIVNTATELSLLDQEVDRKVQELFAKSERFIYDLLVEAQNKGEIAKDNSLEALASYLHNAWLGLRVLVKTSNDKKKLQTIIKTTLSII